jgi:dienelactone hydrolase
MRMNDLDYRADSEVLRGFITYGNTHHAFTNPAADGSFLSGTLYNEQSDHRSWAAMTSFLEEVIR